MYSRSFTCPSCGSQIEQKIPGSRTLVCSYCGQTSHLNADSLDAVGNKHMLLDFGSVFEIGLNGKREGRDFIVLGRLRFDYEDGFWDEWYVIHPDNGEEAWIQEDDGAFVWFEERKKILGSFSYDKVTVGVYDDLQGEWEPTFITEKSKGSINGGEGELPFQIIPGSQVDFVDGIWEGQILSIELLAREKVLFIGDPIELKDLTLS